MFEVTSPVTPEYSSSLGARQLSAGKPSDKDLQRAKGAARIVVGGSEHGTHVRTVFQQAPIRVIFPKLDGGAAQEAVLVNIAGGIAGGDHLEYVATALSGASIAITAQAAEKVYRALSQPAHIATRLTAGAAAKLAWLPQETIVFNRARLKRKTEINLAPGAELLALEWLVLGRAAHQEDMVEGHITDSWRIKKDGRLIWADCFRVTDDVFPYLNRKALLADYRAIATLIYFGPFLEQGIELFRGVASSLGCDCGITSVAELMIVRFAAEASSFVRNGLRGFLQQFGLEYGPGPFRVPKMWSC